MRRVIPIFTKAKRKDIIIDEAKKNKHIIYGARAIQKHLGTISRPTEDFDIFSSNPKKSANRTEKRFDSLFGFNYHYVKKGMNPGTWKVKSLGPDFKKGTPDDEGIVDYTKIPKPPPRFKMFGGVRYRILKEEVKGKKATQNDPEFAFRKEKDKKDLEIIKTVINSSQPKVNWRLK